MLCPYSPCLVRSPDAADDIAQEAFTNAYFHLASYHRHGQFYTWLFRIAMNSRSNYFRRSCSGLSIDERVEFPQRVKCDDRDTPDELAVRNEACEQVRRAMQTLDDTHRKILVLREFEGRDYNDIANLLGIQTGTVRSRLSRARAALKERLAGSDILVVQSNE